MTAVLATLPEANAFLGFTDSDAARDALVQQLLDGAEALLVADTGRQARPFAVAQPSRVELQDSTGTDWLYLDYPAATNAIAACVIGPDFAVPTETLDVTRVAVQAGSRFIRRLDGGRFGAAEVPRAVRVTYSAAADLPAVAKAAVLRATELLWNQRGFAGLKGDRVAGLAIDLAPSLQALPDWRLACDATGDINV